MRYLHTPTRILCLADITAILVAFLAAVTLRFVTGGYLDFALYLSAMPLVFVFPLLYMAFGLYPATFMRRPEEAKRLTVATCMGFMFLILFTFLAKEGSAFSRLAMVLAWLFSLSFVPMLRYAVRMRCVRYDWWPEPCIVFASGAKLTHICRELAPMQSQGIRPVALFLNEHDPEPDLGALTGTLEIIRTREGQLADARALIKRAADRHPRAFALVALDDGDRKLHQHWLSSIDLCFQNIVLIPDLLVGGRVWVMAVTIGHMYGVLLKQNLLDRRRMQFKRALDLVLTLLAGGFFALSLLVISIAIRLDSKGPVFFRQRRIGREGRPFMVYKFRTMALDAPERLQRHLAANPEAKAEWEATQKLKNDPRITRVGNILRQTSLDELPQIFNVLKGEMSLVGPRPIVDNEVEKYGEDFELYTRVRPGITGLWQISGRNNISYARRVWLDKHYVCNWSVWMDLLILGRTIPAVLRGTGAY